jgi:hypothetical protein
LFSFPGPRKQLQRLEKPDERSEGTTANWGLVVNVREMRFPSDRSDIHPDAGKLVRLIQDVRWMREWQNPAPLSRGGRKMS